VRNLAQGVLTNDDKRDLNGRKVPMMPYADENKPTVILSPTNAKVLFYNAWFARNRVRKQTKCFVFDAIDSVQIGASKSFSLPESLTLGIGVRVMFLKSFRALVSNGVNKRDSDCTVKDIVNGTLGVIRDYATVGFVLSRKDRCGIVGRVPEKFPALVVKLDEGGEVFVGVVDEEIDGVRSRRIQFPLCLAYALTIHRSQGKSIDRVHIAGNAKEFLSPGLFYVAVSRATSLEGLSLDSTIDLDDLRLTVDEEVKEFLKSFAKA